MQPIKENREWPGTTTHPILQTNNPIDGLPGCSSRVDGAWRPRADAGPGSVRGRRRGRPGTPDQPAPGDLARRRAAGHRHRSPDRRGAAPAPGPAGWHGPLCQSERRLKLDKARQLTLTAGEVLVEATAALSVSVKTPKREVSRLAGQIRRPAPTRHRHSRGSAAG